MKLYNSLNITNACVLGLLSVVLCCSPASAQNDEASRLLDYCIYLGDSAKEWSSLIDDMQETYDKNCSPIPLWPISRWGSLQCSEYSKIIIKAADQLNSVLDKEQQCYLDYIEKTRKRD